MEHCTQCKAQIRCFFQGLFVQIVTVWKHMKTDGSHLFPGGVSYIARRKDLSTLLHSYLGTLTFFSYPRFRAKLPCDERARLRRTDNVGVNVGSGCT